MSILLYSLKSNDTKDFLASPFTLFIVSYEWVSALFYQLRLKLSFLIHLTLDYQAQYWLYVLIMSRTRFRVNPHSIVA